MSKIWRIVDIIKWVTKFFDEHNIENSRYDAEYIISEVLELQRLELYLHFDQKVSKLEKKLIKSYIVRRANREPLQYIFGKTSFYGYDIKVAKGVLIPRPETEILVETLLDDDYLFQEVLDIGTGSGAISIALKKERNELNLSAIDVSDEAIKIAKENCVLNNCKINIFKSDIFEKVQGKFDLIISNPPYIEEKEYSKLQQEIVNYEPKLALIAAEKGLFFFKKIIENAAKYLNNNGLLAFEIGANQADDVTLFGKNNNLNLILRKKDLNGFDRILIFQK
ncbi:MAG: peptide chain release factor N(5)-glutamine methyltransferase [Candidatus Cloacimonadota bacterium]|nr:peptide chain release factor N(5)-glutamine methyltransferase [Candidatus Cloacimonadota bacterium]